MKTKLRKTIIVLVVATLVLLPSLFALADNVEPEPTQPTTIEPAHDESTQPDKPPTNDPISNVQDEGIVPPNTRLGVLRQLHFLFPNQCKVKEYSYWYKVMGVKYKGIIKKQKHILVPQGVKVNIKAIPYKNTDTFIKWDIPNGDSYINPTTITIPNKRSYISAKFERMRKLTFKKSPGLKHYLYNTGPLGGTISNTKTLEIPQFTVVMITAVAKDGWRFEGWEPPSHETDPTIYVTTDVDKEVKALFTRTHYTLQLEDNTGLDSYTVKYTGYNANHSGGETLQIPVGENVEVTANAAPDYSNDGWEITPAGSTETNSTVQFTMDSNNTVKAKFIPNPTLILEDSEGLENYRVQYDTFDQTYPSGTTLVIPRNAEVTITATAKAEYMLKGWDSQPMPPLTNPLVITMDQNHTHKADFSKMYKVKLHGRRGLEEYQYYYIFGGITTSLVVVSPAEDSSANFVAPEGATVHVKAIGKPYNMFDKWTDATSAPFNDSNENPLTFTMPSELVELEPDFDACFYLTFKDKQGLSHYTYEYPGSDVKTVSSSLGNLGVPLPIPAGENVKIQAFADIESGYIFKRWTFESLGFHGHNPTSFYMLFDRVAQGVFDKLPMFTVYHHDYMSDTGSGDVDVYYNGEFVTTLGAGENVKIQKIQGVNTVELTAVPDTCSQFKKWLLKGSTNVTESFDIVTSIPPITINCICPPLLRVDAQPEWGPDLPKLKVIKKSTDGTLLKGAAFTLNGNDYNESGTTDTNGELIFNNLEQGEYTLTETAAPPNYHILQSTYTIIVGEEDVTQEVVNEEFVEVVVKKIDADTEEPLEGAEFALYAVQTNETTQKSSMTPIATITSNSNGLAIFEKSLGLRAGVTYLIKEITPPSGYLPNSLEKQILIPEHGGSNIEEPVVFENTLKPIEHTGSFRLKKLDHDNHDIPLAGAIFKLTDASSEYSKTLTTNVNGEAFIVELPVGTYTLTEITPPAGYIPPDIIYPVVIEAETITNKTVYNKRIPNSTIVVAKFRKNDTSTRLQGAKFALYKTSVTSANKIGGSKYTDVNGNIVWSSLTPGTYVLVEEATINGYKMPTTTTTTVVVNPGERKVVVLYNEPTASKPTPTPTDTIQATETPTPIPSDDVTIGDEDPPYGPDTGEGSSIFIIIGALVLVAAALIAIRKFVILKKVK